MRKFFLCSILFSSALLLAEEKVDLTVNLKDPIFSQGVISTNKGGIVTGDGIRIQAMQISYTDKVENGVHVKKIVAVGDLMLEYAGQFFVGTRLEFDFINRTGVLTDGKTYVDVWFLGGSKIELKEDGSYYIYGAYITTSEDQDHTWDINAGTVKITREKLLSAKNISFRFIKIPIFWLPSLKSNLKILKESPIRYKILWDKGLGPRLSMRYRVYSWENFNLYFRFDYRLTLGPGAALEADYHSDDNRTIFLSKNYGAYDKEVPDERSPKRYRFQGFFHTETLDQKTKVHMTYDKMSDIKMPSDFKNDDFEVNTQKRTILHVDHKQDNFFGTFNFQPRINYFQSLDQELPLITLGIRPFEIGKTGIITTNYMNGGFLDYVYATDLHKFLKNTHAIRLETRNGIYRPFQFSYLTVMPNLGIIGIFYNNNQHHHSVGQGIFNYGCTLNTRLYHAYPSFKHVIEPYFNFQGYSQPISPAREHYIFSIDDGYARLNLLRTGVRNTFFMRHFLPTFTAEAYTYGLFDKNTALHKIFPRTYLELSLRLPFLHVQSIAAWNIAENVWDIANIAAQYTVNENLAFTCEFRHRSRFDFRKANHENFFLDVARSLDDLLDSPLSDQRNTLLTNIQMRLMPTLTVNFQAHFGWGRLTEPGYSEIRTELIKLIARSWQLKLGYRHIPNDPFQFSGTISLVK
ncbi:MAG: hypothetical protein V4494_02190 [Chlamydiota bacterium]